MYVSAFILSCYLPQSTHSHHIPPLLYPFHQPLYLSSTDWNSKFVVGGGEKVVNHER